MYDGDKGVTKNGVMDPKLGYNFYPGPSQFGGEKFDALLSSKPTQTHFDPEKLQVQVGAMRGVQWLEIHHPWRQAVDYRVCPGRILLSDRLQKRVEVFTLGGQLHISNDETHTHCVFTSSAPFLDLVTSQSLSTLLANEVEILLARQRAARNLRLSGEFDALLLQIEPQALYICCLSQIREKFKRYPAYNDSIMQHFKHRLELEISRLDDEGVWPSVVPELGALI